MTKPSARSKNDASGEASKRPESAVDEKQKHVADDKEIGGPKGPEPTRFGDWEQKGRCSDF